MSSKRHGGFFSFIKATIISIMTYKSKSLRLEIDNDFDNTVKSWNVVVANGRFHGGGMLVAPSAKIDDGLLDITIIGDLSLFEVITNLHHLYNGKILGIKKVSSFTGKKVKAYSDYNILLETDGEQPGTLPVEIDIIPSVLRIISGQ